MKIDIFDTTVPDYSILDKKSLMESLGYESETSLRNAVDSGFIPPSVNNPRLKAEASKSLY